MKAHPSRKLKSMLMEFCYRGYTSECVPGVAGKDEKRASYMKTWGIHSRQRKKSTD